MSADVSDPMDSMGNQEKSVLSRWSSWLLLAAIGLPMLSAYLVFNTGWGIPTGSINKGDLLLPATSMSDLSISNSDGQAVDLFTGKRKWRWLIVGSNECSDRCQNNLYLSRQVHIRLGEKAMRLERVYLNTDSVFDADFAKTLTKDHPRLRQLHVDSLDWRELMSTTNAADSRLNGEGLAMVDQEGFVMMTYNRSHSGADILDDIKRLLKYSYDE